MDQTRIIRRYSAYFPGWAVAFGAHELVEDSTHDRQWLFADEQLGLILTPAVRRLLYHRLLGHEGVQEVVLGPAGLGTGEDEPPLLGTDEARPLSALRALIALPGDLYLYQSYHLLYPGGTRILTLSRRAPLGLIYREMASLRVRMV